MASATWQAWRYRMLTPVTVLSGYPKLSAAFRG
jgi:hypothetical protein